MAQQEEGWPLGLHPLNLRIRLARNRNFSGSTSFNTLLSGSPSSVSDSSSDLDTESTGSFFPDRSTTLGSLIGVPRIVNIPRRSVRGTSSNQESLVSQKNCRSKTWYCFSLCPTDTTDAASVTRNTTPSLAHFLEVERRAAAANEHRRSHTSVFYGPDELALAQPNREPNSLFVNGHIAPPQSSANPWPNRRLSSNIGGLDLEESSGQGVPLMQFPCMCG